MRITMLTIQLETNVVSGEAILMVKDINLDYFGEI